MANISLNQYALILGANTVIGMAKKVGLKPPPPKISVRNLISLAAKNLVPLAPVDLQPANGATGVSNNPYLSFRDPGAGGPAAADVFDFTVSQNNYVVDPTGQLTGEVLAHSPLTPPGVKWNFPLPPGQVTLMVRGENTHGNGPFSSSTFTVVGPPPTPKPTPPPAPSITVVFKNGQFIVTGSKFLPKKSVTIRVVEGDSSTAYTDFGETSDGSGNINASLTISCVSGLNLHFSATDFRPPTTPDFTGDLWSNTVTLKCP
jgi:hypothetical protein